MWLPCRESLGPNLSERNLTHSILFWSVRSLNAIYHFKMFVEVWLWNKRPDDTLWHSKCLECFSYHRDTQGGGKKCFEHSKINRLEKCISILSICFLCEGRWRDCFSIAVIFHWYCMILSVLRSSTLKSRINSKVF